MPGQQIPIHPLVGPPRPRRWVLAPRLLLLTRMRATTFDALLQDLDLLFAAFEPSLTKIRAAFAGLAGLALVWFL